MRRQIATAATSIEMGIKLLCHEKEEQRDENERSNKKRKKNNKTEASQKRKLCYSSSYLSNLGLLLKLKDILLIITILYNIYLFIYFFLYIFLYIFLDGFMFLYFVSVLCDCLYVSTHGVNSI